MVLIVPTTPFTDQRPGTSGLRKKLSVFRQRNYLENFVQAVFDCIGDKVGKTLVVGGDGRYYNDEAIQIVLKMAAAAGFGRALVGKGGILSTPAASHLIRRVNALGGIILSASHNPGGPAGDFGIKYNISNGGPAPEKLTEAIFARSQSLREYQIANLPDVDIHRIGVTALPPLLTVEIVDPVAEYARLMESVFDFDALKSLFACGFSLVFDAMSAVTGPYASQILEGSLQAPAGTVMNGVPLQDFGGRPPDPNLAHARHLVDLALSDGGPDLCAASDGDGDRNLIIGKGMVVTPSDSLAIIAANAMKVPGYAGGVCGVARSMPTSRAADRVARSLGINMFETPTGWKFFGNLLDAGLVNLCGEESSGTGSSHVREKDGLWAVLMWLNILAARKEPVASIVRNHWAIYGRDYHCRQDYEEVSTDGANALIESLRQRLPGLMGRRYGSHEVSVADDFSYYDPVDKSQSQGQGIRLIFEAGGRIVYRLSGTGTTGTTLRVYIERFEPERNKQDEPTLGALSELIAIASQVGRIAHFTGRAQPSIIT